MKSCNVRTIVALIAVVSILTLFCGSIFACILPDVEEAGTMARCPSNPGQRGDENKNVCASNEIAQCQSNIKLPQDVKEIKAVTFIDQNQILYSDQMPAIRISGYLMEKAYLPDKVEIFRKDQNLRL